MKAAYFSHDEDARNDPKMVKLRMKYGIEGYGCYFAILEMFNADPNHSLEYNAEQFEAVSYDLRSTFDIKEFIDRCIEIGLFQCDSNRFWSDSFNRRIAEIEEKANMRVKKASNAAAARWGKQKKPEKKPPEDPFSLDGIDPEWVRVVQAYENNLGLFPVGTAGERLISYYEDMGADVMIEAIKVTNLKNPNNPATYLNAVLKKWVELGVDSLEKAKAATMDHGRKTGQRPNQANATAKTDQQIIRGDFY